MRAVVTESIDLGYLAVPDGGGPGLVVLHDVWGLYDHYEDLARRFAAEGFVTLSVDLYRSIEDRPRADDPGAFMRELSDGHVLAEVRRGVEYLHARQEVAGKVGVTGFCMGGAYTILAGAEVPGIAAVAPFYGILSYSSGLYSSRAPLDPVKKPRAPLDAATSLRCPILGFYGAEDVFVSVSDVRELERRVAKSPSSEIVLYEGAGHAFMNDTRPAAYRPEVAVAAWERLIAFLHDQLDVTRAVR